jgi:chondroitin 4-sulfotransferase 11
MVISDRAKCILVHIQKTGGASIESVLRDNDSSIGSHLHQGQRHMFARDIRMLVTAEVWNEYFKFAFVRNPWDRLVSWYHMCVQGEAQNKFAAYIKAHAPTFEDFVVKTTTGLAERTTYNQLDFVSDEHGKIVVDFIGRYEALEQDFSVIKVKLGIRSDLPHVNRSEHGDYREYYTNVTRQIVAERFEKDIQFFGYAF